MLTPKKPLEYTVCEETVHSISHGVGVLLSVAGLIWMLQISVGAGDPWRIVASSVYGASLILLFLASTLYHALYRSRHRELFRLLDHCAIYLLIAGTYTPFLLVSMRTQTGWWIFGTIWLLAILGIAKKVWIRNRFPRLALLFYLAMGWLIVFAIGDLAAAIGTAGMAWLVAGGVVYSLGTLFYAAERLPFNHAVWHVFVLVGGVCHFLSVIWHVLPTTNLSQ